MIAKIHKKGSSFRGASAYLLHDKERALTAHRVAWTETCNLATTNPQLAWRIMAATAMNQAQLKEQAGIANTGRKSSAHVLHYTLSWREDEVSGLTREEMKRAALTSLRVLGRAAKGKNKRDQFADEHQALIVCHNDEPHPHVHVVVNRVHPDHGVILPSSNDQLALSRWAQDYEKENGKVLCDQRVINNAARDRGEFAKGQRDRPRHILQLEEGKTHRRQGRRVAEQQRIKDTTLAQEAASVKKRHLEEVRDWEKQFGEKKQAIQAELRHESNQQFRASRNKFRPRWKSLYNKHKAELTAFAKREERFLGQLQNAFKATDYQAMLRGEKFGSAIRQMFSTLASKGARLDALRRTHLRETQSLEVKQKAEQRAILKRHKSREAFMLSVHRQRFLQERVSLVQRQEHERREIGKRWRKRRVERLAAWKEHDLTRDEPQQVAEEFNARARRRRRRSDKGHEHER